MDEYYDIPYIEEITTYYCSEGHRMSETTYLTETRRTIVELVCPVDGETRELV